MIEQYNPFKENRTEQMKDLWKYYVPFPGLDGAGKPLVVEGGRGSGKTMFFQCNSWRQVASQLRKKEEPVANLLDEREFVGIYYRVDTTFVSSMRGREEDNWGAIFETYFGICILKELLDMLSVLRNGMSLDELMLINFVKDFSKRLNPNSTVDSVREFQRECNVYLDIIEDKINGVNHSEIRYVNAHRFITDLCLDVQSLLRRDNLLFKIFIDEYETLQEYQQKIVNTLIKHSTLPVIFNIGLRPKGMKTPQTISETETIEAPHDYELLPLGVDSENYEEIVKDICKKRIVLGKEQGKIPPNASDDIEYYLGKYAIEYEVGRLMQTDIKWPHEQKLRDIIETMGEEEGLSQAEIGEYKRSLCDEALLLNSRVHYALICKKTQYTPKLRELYQAFTSNNDRYREWMHNRKFAALFLLCRESKKEKMYYGFDVFSILSSNIVRYFLELCEHAFQIAFLNDYAWDEPLSPESQSAAAQYVSEYKIVDIAAYEPHGHELRVFIQYLGKIFYRLHTGEENTLGEPEPNHFNTKDLSLTNYSRDLIASAVMWNVLQEGEATKKKQSILSPETVDYYMNKIYVPYFGISYRNQRKISIDVELLEQLLSGDESQAKKAMKKFFKENKEDDNDGQLSLFD